MVPPSLCSPSHHQDKLLIHVSLGHRGLEIWTLQETQEKLIDQLGVGDRANSEFGYNISHSLYPAASANTQGLPQPSNLL